jgi:hypothetical protein
LINSSYVVRSFVTELLWADLNSIFRVPYLGGVAVGVALGVATGVAGVVAAGVDPVGGASVGSPVGDGVLVVVPPSPPSPQPPRIVARLNIRAKPKIFVFITPLSPIVARTIFHLLNTIPYLLLFFKCCEITYLKNNPLGYSF